MGIQSKRSVVLGVLGDPLCVEGVYRPMSTINV